MKTFTYKIDKKTYKLNVIGSLIKPKKYYIINNEVNLTKNTNWNKFGYIKTKILNKKIQDEIRKKIILYVNKILIDTFPKKNFRKFKLINYHKYLNKSEHYYFLKKIEKGIEFKKVGFEKKIFENAISKLLGVKVTTKNLQSKKINSKTFALRIVRPEKNDFNPPHKDVYLKRLKNGINIYFPIVGSNKLSSLPILPGSHLLNENEILRTKNGAIVNNVKFRVPCIISCKNGLNLIRPNPNKSQILVFSPYLIHGGGSNDNQNKTRVSLELRFWKK